MDYHLGPGAGADAPAGGKPAAAGPAGKPSRPTVRLEDKSPPELCLDLMLGALLAGNEARRAIAAAERKAVHLTDCEGTSSTPIPRNRCVPAGRPRPLTPRAHS